MICDNIRTHGCDENVIYEDISRRRSVNVFWFYTARTFLQLDRIVYYFPSQFLWNLTDFEIQQRSNIISFVYEKKNVLKCL